MKWATVMLASVVVLVAAPAWADFQAGVEAYDRGDYATANLDNDASIDMWHVNDLKRGLGTPDNNDATT